MGAGSLTPEALNLAVVAFSVAGGLLVLGALVAVGKWAWDKWYWGL